MRRMVSPSATPTRTSPVSPRPFGSIRNAGDRSEIDQRADRCPGPGPRDPRTADENTKPKVRADPPRRDDQTGHPVFRSDRLSREYAGNQILGAARGKHLRRVVLDPESQKPGRVDPRRRKDRSRSPPETVRA